MIYQICRLTIQKPALSFFLSFFLSVSTSLSICTAQETMHKAQPTYRYSMCIYLFMCTCLHMWVYMGKHKDIYRYVCIWVHIYTYVHVYIYIDMYVSICGICVYVSLCVHVFPHVYIWVYMSPYVHICLSLCPYISTSVHMGLCVFICV